MSIQERAAELEGWADSLDKMDGLWIAQNDVGNPNSWIAQVRQLLRDIAVARDVI